MKKLLMFLAFVLISIPLSVAVFAADEGTFSVGDADLSGVVNVRDATYIQKYVAGLILMGDKSLDLADADANGVVNVKDATLIQKFLAGIVTEFPEKEGTTENTMDGPLVTIPSTPVTTLTNPVDTTQTIPTQSPTKPSVDSDGYFDTVIRP